MVVWGYNAVYPIFEHTQMDVSLPAWSRAMKGNIWRDQESKNQYTPHFTLHTLLYTLHSTLYTPHSTLYTPHFPFYILHFTLHTLHFTLYTPHFTHYTEPLKATNLTELCQISLGRRWIRKSNKLTKSKVNPNGTPMYDKLCFGKFCCVKDEETPCGRNSQNIFKVVLNTTKNTHVILGRQWFTTCRLQVITRKVAFTCWIL